MGFALDHASCWIRLFLVHALLLLAISKGGEAREMIDHAQMLFHSKSSPSFFFTFKDIKAGTKKPFYFPKSVPPSISVDLSRAEADSIPFSSKQLPYLYELFSVPRGSKQAIDMEETLKTCEGPPARGETKFCATSMDSLLDFTRSEFGISKHDPNDLPTLFATSFRSADLLDTTDYQNFTVLETPMEIPASKMIGCHKLSYPYTVYYCHTQTGGTKGFIIRLHGENGDEVNAVSVCHMDTKYWDPNHRSFSELGTKPGDPVCHIFAPHGNFLWAHMIIPKHSI